MRDSERGPDPSARPDPGQRQPTSSQSNIGAGDLVPVSRSAATYETETANFNVSWELDLFGRLAEARKVAKADLEAGALQHRGHPRQPRRQRRRQLLPGRRPRHPDRRRPRDRAHPGSSSPTSPSDGHDRPRRRLRRRSRRRRPRPGQGPGRGPRRPAPCRAAPAADPDRPRNRAAGQPRHPAPGGRRAAGPRRRARDPARAAARRARGRGPPARRGGHRPAAPPGDLPDLHPAAGPGRSRTVQPSRRLHPARDPDPGPQTTEPRLLDARRAA